MTPTEHEGTVAVDAAARALHAITLKRMLLAPVDFDSLNPVDQNKFREEVLPIVWAALEALPDRRRAAWAVGVQAGIDAATSVPSGQTYRLPDNPYPEETP